MLTHIRICTMAKFPIADAKWSGVRRSRSLTVEFTSVDLQYSNVVIIDRISDLTTASINCFPIGMERLMSGMNSFVSYFRRIQCSFSSRVDSVHGFFEPFRFDSYTEFESEFPIESKTLKCDVCISSRPRDLTLLICDPRFRWIPEHSMQIRMPKL